MGGLLSSPINQAFESLTAGSSEDVVDLWDLKKLEGTDRHLGLHSAGLVVSHPLVFLMFDVGMKGHLTCSEFVRLITHLQHCRQRVDQQGRQIYVSGNGRDCGFCLACLGWCASWVGRYSQLETGTEQLPQRYLTSKSLKVYSRVIFDRGTGQEDDTQDSVVPMYTRFETSGQDVVENPTQDEGNESKAALTGEEEDAKTEIEERKFAAAEEVRRMLMKSGRAHFRRLIRTLTGRPDMTQWLCRLARGKSDQIGVLETVTRLLQAVSVDGINPENLTQSNRVEGVSLVQQLIQECSMQCLSDPQTGDTKIVPTVLLYIADRVVAEYQALFLVGANIERVNDYDLTKTLGGGASGVVKLAVHRSTLARKAIKIIPRANVATMSKVDVEIQAHKSLSHPNIATLEQVLESKDRIFLVMELCEGGSVYELMSRRGFKPLPESLIRRIFRQILSAVAFSHSKGVCHRDLRLENLLFAQKSTRASVGGGDESGGLVMPSSQPMLQPTRSLQPIRAASLESIFADKQDVESLHEEFNIDDLTIKVIDFGKAGLFEKGWDLFSTTLVGSLYYLSPEQVVGRCYSGVKLDSWACGVVLYQLAVGRLPFFSEIAKELLDHITAAKPQYPDSASTSPLCRDLIGRFLDRDPDTRISAEEALSHPWFALAGGSDNLDSTANVDQI